MLRHLLLIALVCFPVTLHAQTDAQKKHSVAFVRSLQQPDGSFLSSKGEIAGTLRATSSAIRAIKYNGGELPNADKVAKFVMSCYDSTTGGYTDIRGGKVTIYETAVGIMAAVELKLKADPFVNKPVEYLTANANAEDFEQIRIAAAGLEAAGKLPKEVIERWVTFVNKLKNKDGGYGHHADQARQTGGAIALLLRLGTKIDAARAKDIIAILDKGQRADGGFGRPAIKDSDLETTYRVMRAYHMLKAKPPNVDQLRKRIAACRNDDGGYGWAPGEPSSIAGTYFAAIISHWLK